MEEPEDSNHCQNNVSSEDQSTQYTMVPGKIWSSDDYIKMIKGYEERPCLWKKDDKFYKNKIKRSDAMEQIAQLVNATADETRDKIRNFRTTYFQNFKKMKKAGRTSRHPPRWEYFNLLSFLSDDASEADPIDISDYYIDQQGMETADSESMQSYEPLTNTIKTEPNDQNAQQRKRKRSESSITDNDEPGAIFTDVSSKFSARKKSRNSSFGEYVANSLDMILNERIKEIAKQRILMILSENIRKSANETLQRLQSEQQS